MQHMRLINFNGTHDTIIEQIRLLWTKYSDFPCKVSRTHKRIDGVRGVGLGLRSYVPQLVSLHAATIRDQTLVESGMGLFIGHSYWYRLD
jgi:hypothetical protein